MDFLNEARDASGVGEHVTVNVSICTVQNSKTHEGEGRVHGTETWIAAESEEVLLTSLQDIAQEMVEQYIEGLENVEETEDVADTQICQDEHALEIKKVENEHALACENVRLSEAQIDMERDRVYHAGVFGACEYLINTVATLVAEEIDPEKLSEEVPDGQDCSPREAYNAVLTSTFVAIDLMNKRIIEQMIPPRDSL